jgi:hypothetical protein
MTTNPASREEQLAYQASFIVITKLAQGVIKERRVSKARLDMLAYDASKVLREAFSVLPYYAAMPLGAYDVEAELSKVEGQVNLVLPLWFRELALKYGEPK